jgi:hypothetical protein
MAIAGPTPASLRLRRTDHAVTVREVHCGGVLAQFVRTGTAVDAIGSARCHATLTRQATERLP